MLPKQLGKYKIDRWVASGAYGDLYEAVDTVIEQRVAVKVININDSGKRDKASAIQEAKYLQKLNHPNIVRFYHCDLQDNHLLLYMELLEGKSLKTMIKEYHQYTLAQFFRISINILDVVKYIHDCGIIHCDLNTENILLTKNNEIKIIDFGLATRGRDVRYGTPSYTAPEIWKGMPNSIQSDVFSLACIFYEIIKGKQAFPGSSIQKIKNSILNKKPATPKSNDIVMQVIVPVVMKCLKRTPNHRISNCAGLLEILCKQEKILKEKESAVLTAPHKLKKNLDEDIVAHQQYAFKDALIRLEKDGIHDNQSLEADHVVTEIANFIKINGKQAFIRYLLQEIKSYKNVIINMLCPKATHCYRIRQDITEIATEVILKSDDYDVDLIPRLQDNILTGYQIGRYSARIISRKYECGERILLSMLNRKNPLILRNVLHGLSELKPNEELIRSINNVHEEYSGIWYIRDLCSQILGKWGANMPVNHEQFKVCREANILIVSDQRCSDEIKAVEKMREGIMLAGYRQFTVVRGNEAINEIREGSVDIVLAEIVMNDITGLSIAKFAKQNSLNAKVVIITGDDTIGEAFDAVLDDAEMYIIRPISESQVVRSVGMLAVQMGLRVPEIRRAAYIS